MPGEELRFIVSGANPDEEIYVVRSTSGEGAGPCLGSASGLCLDLIDPAVHLSANADEHGVLSISQTLPATVPVGTDVWFQGGDEDVAVATTWGGEAVEIWHNDGAGQLSLAYTLDVYQPTCLAVGDWNGDGTPDLAGCLAFGFSVYLNDGHGQLEFHDYTDTSWTTYLTSGDVDADGDDDILFVSNSGYASAFHSDGDGDFTMDTGFEEATTPRWADVDSDGDLDMLRNGAHGHMLMVELNQGDGTFGIADPQLSGISSAGMDIGDLNGDGHPDVVLTDHDSDQLITLFGDGAGDFTVDDELDICDRPMHLVLADINVDGNLDAAVSCLDSGTVEVWMGRSSGRFHDPQTAVEGTLPQSAHLVDLDDDGVLDLFAVMNDELVSVGTVCD